MESKRQRFFKTQIKQLSKPAACQKTRKKEMNTVMQSNKPKRRTRKPVNANNTHVTVLSSPSYHNQNKDIILIRNEIGKNNENHFMQVECEGENIEIGRIEEEKQTEKEVIDKVSGLIKEGDADDVTIKDYYDSFIRIELELDENGTENISELPVEDENTIYKNSKAETKENTTKDPEEYLYSKTVKDLEKEFVTENQNSNSKEIEEEEEIQNLNEIENKKVHPELQTKINKQNINEPDIINMPEEVEGINKDNIIDESEFITIISKQSKRTTENMKEKNDKKIIEQLECNINESEVTGKNIVSKEIEEPSKDLNIMEINLNEDKSQADFLSENDKDRQYDSPEQLYPTIEPIPDHEIDIILRKSLEDDHDANKDEQFSSVNAAKPTKRIKREINKSYVDFLSEDEDFYWDSTSWKETGEDTSSSEQDKPKKKKKKKGAEDGKVGEEGLKKKKTIKRKVRKESKNKGESYVKKDGFVVKEKELQPNPCIGKNCGHKCDEVSEQKRQALFTYFWNLPPQRKKDWLVAMSSKKDIKRKRSKDSSYRQQTFEYFINDGEGRRQVCQKFIINTLNITQRYIYYTLTTASQGIAKEDARGKTVPGNKTPNLVRESAKDFIKALPALPSHYCRKDSTRLYLPIEFKNIKNLYRIYKQEWTSKGLDVVNENLFRDIFNKDFNVGFHIPKKDKCLKCMKFEGQDQDIPEFQEHLAEKKASKTRLECHREIGKVNPSILCTSFDLQKVLNTPHGNSMLLFYSRKYAVYNLCFYESVTRNGFCYVWGETEGKRGGNEVATILQKYVEDVDSRGSITSLILYSDCCPGQNRNKIVLASLHNALLQSKNIETLQMNYLLPGHTEMTVDSIHSTIESSIRNTTVWAPSQWLTICQLARKEPRPYNVEALSHHDFKSFDELSDKYFKGNLAGKINKIRTATFKKSSPSIMKIKFSMQTEAREEKVAIHAKPKSIKPRYKSSLPITKSKYNDLKKLCENGTIPRIFHNEYLSFPNYNGKDVLLDTDIEDETEEKE